MCVCTCTHTHLIFRIFHQLSLSKNSRTFGFYMCWADHQTRLALQPKACFFMNQFKSDVPVIKTFAISLKLSVTLFRPLRLSLWWLSYLRLQLLHFHKLQVVLSRMDPVTILVLPLTRSSLRGSRAVLAPHSSEDARLSAVLRLACDTAEHCRHFPASLSLHCVQK